ncbi:DUF4944 domain-containing protein [Bacillus vallismortis]|uniref:DUF4944 domain-containing protein n=1 Tax=Bacillus vallismortis TaxID=72361 RepID=UPI00028A3B5C|nr:DUF4944 domain-containing protein [Bacillus vallismortis]MBG9768749.1 hypothetical protein [Bacillus vallismortis]MEC1270734.1 DUF4944 domain-containing protein [Bacillus vallismortis]QAV08490.1 DUF4944 domain-containing protein [Bacillus vallismortis]
MRKKNNMKKWLLIIAVFVVIFTVSIFVIMSGNKVKYEGSGKSGLWFSNIEKSDKNSIGPNYFLNLYWQGSKKDEKRTVVSKITLYIDGKKYDDREDYDLSEYTGEEMPEGGQMPDHIATFDFMPEEEVIGHDLLVKVEWKTGGKKQTEDIKLYKKTCIKREPKVD